MKNTLTIGERPMWANAVNAFSTTHSLRAASRSIGSPLLLVACLLIVSLPCGESRADVVQLAEPVRTSTWTDPVATEFVSRIQFRDQADALPGEALPPVDAESSRVALEEDGLKPIGQLTIDTAPQPGEIPEDLAAARFAQAGQVWHPFGTNRPWNLYSFWWEAPALCHQPLYFEEVNLERYGYSHGVAQPMVSAAHFFGTIPALPYLMAANPPRECIYTLGHYLPGSCAPYHVYYPPLSLKGAVVEAGVMTGLFFVLP